MAYSDDVRLAKALIDLSAALHLVIGVQRDQIPTPAAVQAYNELDRAAAAVRAAEREARLVDKGALASAPED